MAQDGPIINANPDDNPDAAPRRDLIAFGDSLLQVVAGQISANYLKFVKARLATALDGVADMHMRELRTLMALDYAVEPISGATIARWMVYDPATVTRSTQWLLNAGYILAEESARDKRSTVFRLSPEGEHVTRIYREKTIIEFEAFDAITEEPLSREEVKAALKVIMKIRNRAVAAAQYAQKRT